MKRLLLVGLVIIGLYSTSVGLLSYFLFQQLTTLHQQVVNKEYTRALQTTESIDRYGKIWLTITTPFKVIPEINSLHAFFSSSLVTVATGRDIITTASAYAFDALPEKWHTLQTSFETTLATLPGKDSLVGRYLPSKLYEASDYYAQNQPYIAAISEVMTHLPELLGYTSPKHYVVLFQNNMELRPTGGFMGSFAEVWVNQGRLVNFSIQDIYVPDGQIKGYVAEPKPIKQYLFSNNHPGWRLRDANWHPDFTQAVTAIDWFFREGGVEPVDGYVAINLQLILDILRIAPVEVSDYGLTVSADNFYYQAQRHAEENFFPGSTQKGDFLRSVGRQLLINLPTRTDLIPSLLPIVLSNLERKHISVYVPGVNLPSWHNLGWDGSLLETTDDYLMINESNMGATKANCCIDRQLSHVVTVMPKEVKHQLTMGYVNNNPDKPIPPAHWGGGYKNYIRIIVPAAATLNEVRINSKLVPASSVDTEVFTSGHTSFGFLTLIEGGQTATVTVDYSVPRTETESRTYSLYFQKQAGILSWPVTLTIRETPDKNSITELYQTQTQVEKDAVFQVSLERL